MLRYELVIFVISTTGQGDIPGNATSFWKSLLRKKLPPTCLSRLKFSIFGLGDSSYQKYDSPPLVYQIAVPLLITRVTDSTGLRANLTKGFCNWVRKNFILQEKAMNDMITGEFPLNLDIASDNPFFFFSSAPPINPDKL